MARSGRSEDVPPCQCCQIEPDIPPNPCCSARSQIGRKLWPNLATFLPAPRLDPLSVSSVTGRLLTGRLTPCPLTTTTRISSGLPPFCFFLTPDFYLSYLLPHFPPVPVGSPEGVLLQREFHLLCVGSEEWQRGNGTETNCPNTQTWIIRSSGMISRRNWSWQRNVSSGMMEAERVSGWRLWW